MQVYLREGAIMICLLMVSKSNALLKLSLQRIKYKTQTKPYIYHINRISATKRSKYVQKRAELCGQSRLGDKSWLGGRALQNTYMYVKKKKHECIFPLNGLGQVFKNGLGPSAVSSAGQGLWLQLPRVPSTAARVGQGDMPGVDTKGGYCHSSTPWLSQGVLQRPWDPQR